MAVRTSTFGWLELFGLLNLTRPDLMRPDPIAFALISNGGHTAAPVLVQCTHTGIIVDTKISSASGNS